ncbi:MAG TPA: hypothetical protein VG322_16870 [Candidatus Acidoferrales bacterium]|nr:hypothetical protein [Candidatus Acidoferrales bacterium]
MLILFAIATCTRAQIVASGYVGFGTAIDGSVGPLNTLGGGMVYNAPSLGGLFDTIGGDVIFFHNLGIGAEVSFRNRGPYAGLTYRPNFYDVNAVYERSIGRFSPEFQGGIGRANINFYYTPQFCATFPQGCQSTTAAASGANYLELHLSGGVGYNVYKSVFIRPQVDIRYVKNMSYFSSPWVPEFSVAIGYTFRRGT